MTTQRSSQILNLEELIAGPLIATIEADSMSTQKYLNFVMNTAFENYNPKTGETGELRMISFNYKIYNNIDNSEHKVKIPLITLIPLPLLQIKEAEFNFDIKIHDVLHSETSKLNQINTPQDKESHNRNFKMRASLTPQEILNTRDNIINSNMKIHVKMQQADMPSGLAKLLHTSSKIT